MLEFLMPEEWRPIEGYEAYEVSDMGRVKRVLGQRRGAIVTPVIKKPKRGSMKRVVRLALDGKRREVSVSRLVAKAFVKGSGECVVHVNRNTIDDRADNLAWTTRSALGARTGSMSKSKGVLKVDASGEIAGSYRSAREAGRESFLSYQAVMDCANGVTKRGFCPDGYRYVWDDSVEGLCLLAKSMGVSPRKMGVSARQASGAMGRYR